jgi:hypothetical protein
VLASLDSVLAQERPDLILVQGDTTTEMAGALAGFHQRIPVGEGARRRSSMKVLRHTMAVLLSGFLFRSVMFFLIPGFALLIFAAYVNAWVVIHFLTQYQNLPQYTWFLSRASNAVAAAYQQFPHTFIVSGLSSMLAIQLISLGILALQSKSYFAEIFHLGTALLHEE